MTTTEPTIVRQGKLTCKANKTDPAQQTWLGREWSDGTIEQFHHFGERSHWVVYHGEHAQEIVWEQ